jgi:hypothetical protein
MERDPETVWALCKKINPVPLAGIESRIFRCPAHSPVLILSMLSQLSSQD